MSRYSDDFIVKACREISVAISSTAPCLGGHLIMILLCFTGLKKVSIYLVLLRPKDLPISTRYICAHKSFKPFGVGVPVRPTTLSNIGRIFLRALNLFAALFLNDVISSMTSISKRRPFEAQYSSTEAIISLPATYISPGVLSSLWRRSLEPWTDITRRSLRCSHEAASCAQVLSATFLGATTSTFDTSIVSISSWIAVRVMTLLPSPICRNKAASLWDMTKSIAFS